MHIRISSRLRSLLLLCALAAALLAATGYESWRGDQKTQVPMLMKALEPELFPRDWFLSGTGQEQFRGAFLALEKGLYRLFRSIDAVLFVQYAFYLLVFTGALAAFCRRLPVGRGTLLAWLFLIAFLNEYATFGGAYAVEHNTIPRMYPYAACYAALPLLLSARTAYAALAGLLMGAAGLMQGAPSLQFLPLLCLWLFTLRDRRSAACRCLLLVGGFFAAYWPQALLLKGAIAAPAVFSPAEVIHYLAVIRHPHLMLPRHFPVEEALLLAGLLLFWGVLQRRERNSAVLRPVFRLLAVMLAFFLAATWFIEAMPVAKWIIFQPMRMVGIFRALLYLLVAWHLRRTLDSPSPLAVVRMALLLGAAVLFQIKAVPGVFASLLLLETLLVALRPRLAPASAARLDAWAALPASACWLWQGGQTALTVAAVCLVLHFHRALPGRLRALTAWLRNAPAPRYAAVALALAFFLALWLLPFQKWGPAERKWSRAERLHCWFAWRYQVHPFPFLAEEFAACWTRDHTPADALFLVRPDRGAPAFNSWSRRSQFFNIKCFPFLQTQWTEWTSRYLAVRGVQDPARDSRRRDRVLQDPGGAGALEDFKNLSADYLVELADRYGCDYVMFTGVRPLTSPRLEKVAGPFMGLRARMRRPKKTDEPASIYRVLPPAAGSPAIQYLPQAAESAPAAGGGKDSNAPMSGAAPR